MDTCTPACVWPALDRGQALVEYALLLALVAILVLVSSLTFGRVLQDWFQQLLATITRTLQA